MKKKVIYLNFSRREKVRELERKVCVVISRRTQNGMKCDALQNYTKFDATMRRDLVRLDDVPRDKVPRNMLRKIDAY